ncbi:MULTISPECIES: DMT family transporter [unclassified Rhizobium]|uniref:DMT family transporter n=1 Tax=unclassified Rhizobium TaxID=2613769 RepID=UPI001FEF57B9|nr:MULTISPECIES: DMT family transporter [unclassified Rhizobium]
MTASPAAQEGAGALLVFLSAVAWSFGGALARYLDIDDSWTVVCWRGLFAGLFLLGFLLLRDGPRKTLSLYRNMGAPGLLVAFGFAVASSCFVIAISYTTVANVVLIQAGVPLFAALIAWILFRERVTFATWLAIAAVIAGVAIMVAGGPLLAALTGHEAQASGSGVDYPMAWFGNLLALAIAIVFAMTTVVTRRFPNVRQTPGASLGCFAASAFAATQASGFAVTPGELGVLFVFGALNLGLGMALFVTGARLIPSAFAALLGTAETMLGPVWVAIFHGEIPGVETVIGGLIILAALIFYLSKALKRQAPAPAIAAKP